MDTTETQQQRGILKLDTQQDSSQHPLPKRNILWDEEAIASQEAKRGTRQKITEPKTPFISYNHETDEILGCSGVFIVSLRWILEDSCEMIGKRLFLLSN